MQTSRTAHTGRVVASPYFSQKTKSICDESEIDSAAKLAASKGIQIPVSSYETPVYWPLSEDEKLFTDPNFCFHFNQFLRLYQDLYYVRPQLIQEIVAHDPWKVLIVAMLLNKTSGKLAVPVFWEILAIYPSPWSLSQADEADLAAYIRPLGLQTVRSRRLISLSKSYLRDPPCATDLRPSRPFISSPGNAISPTRRSRYPPTPVSHLPGTGTYALDSFRIFCTVCQDPNTEEWKSVMPTDKELIRFLRWKWAFHERKQWNPEVGVGPNVDAVYLDSLICDLRATEPY